MSQPNLRDMIGLEEAAESVGTSVRTIRRYIDDGRIKAYRLGPRTVRIHPDELSKLLVPISPSNGVVSR